MSTPPVKEGTLGFLTYLLVSAAIATTFLLGALLVGSSLVQDRVSFPSLGDTLDSGLAYVMALVAFFVVIPVVTAGVAALFGRRAGITGLPLRGASALNALVGVPVSYIMFAIAMLIASGLVGEDGQRSAFSAVLDLTVEGFLFMLIALGPLVGFAALVTGAIEKSFVGTDTAHTDYAEYGGHGHAHEHPPAHDHGDHIHITCPRCHTEFTAEGERPLRIVCPNCGKTGTMR